MSVVSHLRRLRAALLALLTARAILLAGATALLVLAVAGAVDVLAGLPLDARRYLRALALLCGLAALAVTAWRARRVIHLDRVALWVEERQPALEYQVVTAAQQPGSIGDAEGELVRRVRWGALMMAATRRALTLPVTLAAVAIAALAFMPDVVVARVRSPQHGDALDRVTLPGVGRNHLAPVAVSIHPPAYSGAAARVLEDPVSIQALAGSRIIVRGAWTRHAQVTATLGASPQSVTRSDGRRWATSLPMPAQPMVLRLRDGEAERILTVEPIVDRPPVVTLTAPARDSVLRQATGAIALSADVTDDIGISVAMFEIIVSSGEGESFTFKSRTLALVRPARGRRSLFLRDTVALDRLDLKPGDIIHLRAVARDANDVSGAGRGSSETRTLRIARAGEYDSVAVEAASPPNPEEGVISQRMLIMLAEGLEKRRSRLTRHVVISESQAIGRDQRKLRKRVGEIIFTRLGDESHSHDEEEGPEGDMTPEQLLAAADSATNAAGTLDFAEGESPVVAINKPLLEAYHAMWDATRELDAGEPGRALPAMRAALAAIQRARNAERVYLRGRASPVVVDLAKVRLQGKERATAAQREAREPSPDPRVRLARRLATILAMLETPRAPIVDSLLVLRVDALSHEPALAAALAEAAESMRRGRDATGALIRARRSLEPDAAASPAEPLWSGW